MNNANCKKNVRRNNKFKKEVFDLWEFFKFNLFLVLKKIMIYLFIIFENHLQKLNIIIARFAKIFDLLPSEKFPFSRFARQFSLLFYS